DPFDNLASNFISNNPSASPQTSSDPFSNLADEFISRQKTDRSGPAFVKPSPTFAAPPLPTPTTDNTPPLESLIPTQERQPHQAHRDEFNQKLRELSAIGQAAKQGEEYGTSLTPESQINQLKAISNAAQKGVQYQPPQQTPKPEAQRFASPAAEKYFQDW